MEIKRPPAPVKKKSDTPSEKSIERREMLRLQLQRTPRIEIDRFEFDPRKGKPMLESPARTPNYKKLKYPHRGPGIWDRFKRWWRKKGL